MVACWGCEGTKDSIKHYGFCSRYHACCRRFLNLEPPEAVHRLEDFLLLRPASRWRRGDLHETGVNAAAMRALSVYALYRTHNTIRLGATARNRYEELFKGYLREGVRNHPKAMALLNGIFKRRLP